MIRFKRSYLHIRYDIFIEIIILILLFSVFCYTSGRSNGIRMMSNYYKIHRIREVVKLVEDSSNIAYAETKGINLGTYEVTAYDLSYQSCGKYKSSEAYGMTYTGLDITGKTWNEARVVAVDPRYINLGSELFLEFHEGDYKKYNGVYYAEDIGGRIKGRKLDFFIGDFDSIFPSKEALEFGKVKAAVYLSND